MTDKPKKLQPALVGGLVAGLLSVVPFVGQGCCLWGIVGGAVAAYMLIKRSPVFRVTTGDGATVGTLAGLFGALIMVVINVPRTLSRWGQVVEAIKERAANQNDPSAQETLNNFIAFLQNHSVLGALLIWLIVAVVLVGLATLGGLIGVAMFEKRKGQPLPPQGPPNFAPPGPPPGGPTPPDQPPY